MTTLATGDRVEMRAGEDGWMGVPIPDLGRGTVVATTQQENPSLMEGFYVEVEWDNDQPRSLCYPAIQSLRKATA